VTESSLTPAENMPEIYREAWRGMAEAMYQAYGDSVEWKAVSGHPMPEFKNVGPRVEGAWCIAAERAYRYSSAISPQARKL